jgi:hypothetical protein
MVLVVTTRSQDPTLVLLQEKEPWKTKTAKDWEKEKKLQKTFESIIQQMQASKGTLQLAPRSKPPMQESFRPPKIKIYFVNNGTITKKMMRCKKLNNNY